MEKEALDYWEVAHLISVKKWNGVKRISLLKGLFLYRSDGESSDFRIFYLPIHLRWSGNNSPNPSLAESVRLETEGGEGGFLQKIGTSPTQPSPSRGEGKGGGDAILFNAFVLVSSFANPAECQECDRKLKSLC